MSALTGRSTRHHGPVRWQRRFHRGSLRTIPRRTRASVDPGWARYFAGLKAGARARGAEPPLTGRSASASARAAADGRSGSHRIGGRRRRTRRGRERQAGGRVAAYPGLRESRPPDRQPRPAGPGAARASPTFSTPTYFGLSDADMETEFVTGSRTPAIPAAHASSRTSSRRSSSSTATPSARSSRTSRTPRSGCGCRINFQSERHAAPLQRRGEEEHSLAAHGRRRPGALPAHQVRRPEAILARGRRQPHSAAR